MKKIKPKKKKIKAKLQRNPKLLLVRTIHDYIENAIKNEIIVKLTFISPNTTNLNKLNSGQLWVKNEYFGVLFKPSWKWKAMMQKDFGFQFNPLSQWKYEKHEEEQEKVQPIKRTNKDPEFIDYGNEYITLLNIEKQFDHDEPTFEWGFDISEIDYIDTETNNLSFFPRIIFNPKLIMDLNDFH